MKMPTLPLLLCALVLLNGVAESQGRRRLCPRGWSPAYGRCFKYVSRRLTWAQAERNCLSMRGNLASIRSPGEYKAVQRIILRVDRKLPKAWIGGSDAAQEKMWLWSDGRRMTYTNWCRRQPDNARCNEDCLEMNYSGKKCWNDLNCALARASVCVLKKRTFWRGGFRPRRVGH
ncbi:ladderlectin-like [Kryptolebias marmoratus]|uniref:Type-2 ice-structuring protein-like n=1 Tax=Kryptolebias marmoratus TaxID=37003 RepID=A0A3Q3EMR0_KRYMA|nr:ladderlectin-like [Kryptolebias marmoratus]